MRNRNSKIITLVVLIVAVIGLGMGFAAFSSTLTISSGASVTPSSSSFSVGFSQSTCTPSGTATVSSSGTVSGTSVSGIRVSFTEPGDSVTCSLTASNSGEYIAYLNSITVGKVTCAKSSGSEAADSLVAAACSSISVTVGFAGSNVIQTTSTSTTAGTKTGLNGYSIAKGSTATVGFVITYASTGARADGAFDITVPTATLKFDSYD